MANPTSERTMTSIFPETLGYYIEKIGEAIGGRKPDEFGAIHVDLVSDIVREFKNEIENKHRLKDFPGLEYTFEEVEYPLEELRIYLTDRSTSRLNNKDASIFLFFVYDRVKQLKGMAKEFDEDPAA